MINLTDDELDKWCELCGNPTNMTGTLRCDRCWELEKRIKDDVEIARTILLEIDRETKL